MVSLASGCLEFLLTSDIMWHGFLWQTGYLQEREHCHFREGNNWGCLVDVG